MAIDHPALSSEVMAALEVARSMAAAGIPVFVARPNADSSTGFAQPRAWQTTPADPLIVDTWQPGDALCAVMGASVDLIDFDPRNGSVWPEDTALPTVYGSATTPSGGVHAFIRSLGAGSKDGVFPGIDIKGGLADGSGRGFAFIAPTVKASKVTGDLVPYRWVTPLDVVHAQVSTSDNTGAALAAKITASRAGSPGALVPSQRSPDWYRAYAEGTEAHSAARADQVIERELDAVGAYAGGLGGGFRGVLMRAALILGGYVGAGHLERDLAVMKLQLTCGLVWGQVDPDDMKWIEQGLTDGAARPFRVYTAVDQTTSPDAPADGSAPWSFYHAIGVHPFDPDRGGSDQELAEQVLARFRPGLRATSDAGSWVVRFQPDVWEESKKLAKWSVGQAARLMPLGEKPIPKDHAERTPAHWQAERRNLFMSSAGTSKVSEKIDALTRGNHPATVRLTDLDADPEILWAGGVPWDLRGSLYLPKQADVDPGIPHLHTARFTPDPDVPTPLWDAFVAAVWPDDAMRAWALRVLSVSVTGHSPRVLPLLYGEGGRGKSQLVELLAHVLGTYGGPGDPRLISDPGAHASIIYALKGMRLVYIDEPPSAQHDKVERIKMLTGGGRMTGNSMYANPVTFSPTHTMIMMTNEPPVLTDDALRDRAKVLGCVGDPAEVSATRKALGWVSTQTWSDEWAREAPGVLAAVMREAAAWLADTESAGNDRSPLSVQTAVSVMVAASDPIQQWMEECTVPAEPGTRAVDLHRRFGQWFAEHPEYRRRAVPGSVSFGARLTKLGVGNTHTREGNFRHLAFRDYGTPWAPMPSDGSVKGSTPHGEGSETQPFTPNNARSTPVLPDSVTGVKGSSLVTSQELNNTHVKVGEESRENRLHTAHTPHENVANPAPTSVNTGVRGTREGSVKGSTDPSRDAASTGLSRTALAKLKREEKKAAKLAEVLATKAAKLAEAAGVHLGLPAAMRRGEQPRSVTLDEAWSIGLACIQRSGRLAVDVETTGYPIGHHAYGLRTIQLGDAMEGIDLDATDPGALELATRLIADAPELNAHSATADLAPLALAGVLDYAEAFTRMDDTALRAKLADPAGTDNESGLKGLAPAVLGEHAITPAADDARKALFSAGGWLTETEPITPPERSGWLHVDPGCVTMITYAISDVLDCAALRIALPEPPAAVLARERRAQAVTAPTAYLGLPLNAERVAAQLAEREPRVAAGLVRVQALGVDNPASPKQLVERFTALGAGAQLGRTKKGGASADAETLGRLKPLGGHVGDLAGAVLDYRADATLLQNMLRPWSLSTTQGNGRTYTTIYTLGADTGRMSSVRQNMQQVSREGGLRECVEADPGHLLIAADFSSVEVRMAAAVSGDEALKRMVIDGVDLHSVIAEQVFGPDFTKANRYTVKRGVFGRLYGGGIENLAKQVGVSTMTMGAVVETMDHVAAGVAAWSKEVREAIKAGHTQYPSYSGRIIHLDPDNPHKGPNYIIQGSARELLVDALIKWDSGPYAGGLVLPVHDEIVAMVPEADADNATHWLVQCMTTEVMGVPITVEADAPSPCWTSAV